MTAVPLPPPSQSEGESNRDLDIDAANSPVSALKELVASFHREQHKVQNLLSSLGFALRSFNNLNQFLELIPLMAARVADAEGGALIQFKPDGQVQLEQFHCQSGQLCESEIRSCFLQAARQLQNQLSRSPKEKSAEGIPQELAASLDEAIQPTLPTHVRLFGTPILVRGQARGRIFILTCDRNYAWSMMRQKLVQLVADQAAVAIANNDLATELRQKERLDRELEIASDIQFHLLPRHYPDIEGIEIAAECRTANRVGGDYYDFIPANYDCPTEEEQGSSNLLPWSIVIGDVMGKGVPAGLIMTLTRGMLRAEVLNRHSPARILEHLNRVLYDDLDNSRRFVTLFYSEYDPKTRQLSFSNAAHNPPLWWQAATDNIERLDTVGMLIGLDTDSVYADARVELLPGDTILYYTDGFTDAVNRNGERFEEENLIAAFRQACQKGTPPQAILEELFAEVDRFTGVGTSNDDMTLVVMQVKNA